ncbi:nitroreductase family protein [Corynebacterium tuberculostearicum]|uniref:nitroreductase family protein n=1 Tax=Corynebacterium TaxID=1716 RepID=UPI001EF364ED|nr:MULTISPECIES: nitroreductase family protein [Corynebacterium]MCG7465857.1 nitroreductase family protein [Corynebacterium sp. ACRPJ]
MTSSNKYSEFIRSRHSPRAFLPEPMPVEDIKQVLEDAQSAPSNSNTQPWNVHVVGGEELKELSAALIKEFDTNGLSPDFTTDYGEGIHPQRSQELAAKMYGLLGIKREDKEGRMEFIRETCASLVRPMRCCFLSRRWETASAPPLTRELTPKTSCFPSRHMVITAFHRA